MAKDTRKAFRGIVVAEGHYDHSVSFDTRAELEAYGDGVSKGAGLYGCGSCYMLAADELDADDLEEKDRALIRKHLAGDTTQ